MIRSPAVISPRDTSATAVALPTPSIGPSVAISSASLMPAPAGTNTTTKPTHQANANPPIKLGAPDGRAALLSVGGFAFAWCVGFVVVFAPAGAGIREALLIATLSPMLDVGRATAVTLVSRLLMTAGDLITAGTAAALARGRSGSPGRETAP